MPAPVKRRAIRWAVVTVASARLLQKLLPVAILGVFLEVCLIVYAMAWFFGTH